MNTRLIAAVSAVAFLATLSAASAAEATGTISSISPTTVTLAGGKTFHLANTANSGKSNAGDIASNFKAGDKVTVVYTELGDRMTATQVIPQ